MAYRYGDRIQLGLLPQCIEDYVAKNDPVRVYDAFVETLNLETLGISLDPQKVGNSEYDPKAMLKLLVYGYSYGVKSSRKLEREVHHNLSFIWLMGGLKPDHKTIAEFRRRNLETIKKILKECALVCMKLDLIDGNVLFVDGTRIRANASRSHTHSKAYYQKLYLELDNRIQELLKECDHIDTKEEGRNSYVSMKKELTQKNRLKQKIEEALKSFKNNPSESTPERTPEKVNLTDPDCKVMHSSQGSHASYNLQSVVDDKHGLIIQVEAVNHNSDIYQFSKQIEQANEILKEGGEKPCKVGCADAGYANTCELQKIDEQGIKVIVPSQRQALHQGAGPFHKSRFIYDKEQNVYLCPMGQTLKYVGTDRSNGKRQYQISNPDICQQCPHYGVCTTSLKGRKIKRLPHEEIKERMEAQYEEVESQEIYARRKSKVELPFGHIKRNLKTDAFLLRRLKGVGAEASLLATCFNLVRMVSILGVSVLIGKLSALSP